jgi:hypothetical protein
MILLRRAVRSRRVRFRGCDGSREESEVAMPANEEPIGVGLAEAIGQVRAELERAVEDGKGSSVAFKAGPVELEFDVGFTRTGGVSGGFQLSVLSFGVKGDRSSTGTHRVKIVLTPVSRDGGDKLIGDVGPRDDAPGHGQDVSER